MLYQLVPLFGMVGIFGLYTLWNIATYVWDESMKIAAEDHSHENIDNTSSAGKEPL